MLGRPRVLVDVVEEHFDELDFLLDHREANLFAKEWTLHELAQNEERAEAHLDGLRLAELNAVDLATERLACGERFAAAAATLVLFDTGESRYHQLLLESLRHGEATIVDGIRIALRHCAIDGILEALRETAAGPEPIPAAAALDVLAFQRRAARGVESLLGAEDPWIRVLALGCSGRLKALRAQDLTDALRHPEPSVRRVALQEAARAGLDTLHETCRAAATRGTDPDPEALRFLGVLGDPRDLMLLQQAMGRRELAPAALEGIGALGSVESVPRLLELLGDAALGVAAAEAYERITGAEIRGDRRPSNSVANGDEDDPPVPADPAKARADWERRRPEMTVERAWQAGIALDDATLPPAFHDLPLPVRRDVYLRLRSRSRAGDLELEAHAVLQRRELGGSRGAQERAAIVNR
jgi:uncharacterized protein (TIGR02270 family)